jgi:hypothetical protein
MTCPAYGSSSNVSLWYAIDPDPAAAIPDGSSAPNAFEWFGIPMTGESLNANLSSTISEIITPERSYAGSKLTQGEVGGDINFELMAGPFVNNMLISVLQANQALDVGADEVAGTSGVAISAVGTLVDDDRTVNLTGVSAVEGASYSVVIDGENFTHVATTGQTLSQIATALALLIDNDATYVATAGTNTITISAGAGLSLIEFTSWVVAAWAPGEALTNGSTTKCLAIMKRVMITSSTYDWYIFRGCQISSLSLDMKPNALITGTISVMGVRPDDPVEATALPTHWTFTRHPNLPLMSGVDSLESLEVQTSAGVDSGATLQDFSLKIDNQLRQQQAVGLGHPFSAGVASGRFMASANGTAYYANPRIYNDFLDDASLKIVMELRDDDGNGYDILMDYVKVTSGSLPEAGGPDQDLTVSTEFRAFESATNGTIKVTRKAV